MFLYNRNEKVLCKLQRQCPPSRAQVWAPRLPTGPGMQGAARRCSGLSESPTRKTPAHYQYVLPWRGSGVQTFIVPHAGPLPVPAHCTDEWPGAHRRLCQVPCCARPQLCSGFSHRTGIFPHEARKSSDSAPGIPFPLFSPVTSHQQPAQEQSQCHAALTDRKSVV